MPAKTYEAEYEGELVECTEDSPCNILIRILETDWQLHVKVIASFLLYFMQKVLIWQPFWLVPPGNHVH